jgi:D-glutamate cyclase
VAVILESASLNMATSDVFAALQDIVGTDAGNRGMKSLIVPGDLEKASRLVTGLSVPSTVIVLSGFPCCVNESPPSETDGPPGTFAIARAAAALGHHVIVVTETCNGAVLDAARKDLVLPSECGPVTLEIFPSQFSEDDEQRFRKLAEICQCLIACERAGPGKDGRCYTMRGIDMNAKGLIAPLHRLVTESDSPFIAIGDGGNELGMGKVLKSVVDNPKIMDGDKIGCVIPADYLIASSVSNWGGYALAAGIALAEQSMNNGTAVDTPSNHMARFLPTVDEEVDLLNRCVAAGCRDGVSGKMEATVDGMPLETSMKCLRDIRAVAMAALASTNYA